MSKNKSADKTETKEKKAKELKTAASETPAPETGRFHPGRTIARLLMWIVFLGVMLGLWLNPEIIYNAAQHFKNTAGQPAPEQQQTENLARLRRMQTQLNDLQNRIEHLPVTPATIPPATETAENIAKLNERFDNLEKQISAIIDSKADSATVLGLINRVDKNEQRLDNMAKISDQGALILTTVMMIKDAAARGNNFDYEAEVLSQLTAAEPELQTSAAEILKFAHRKLPSLSVLINDFNKIYVDIDAAEKEKAIAGKDWKQRLNMKLKEYVTVKHTNKDGSPVEEETPDQLSLLKEYVNNARFAKALEQLNRPEGQPLAAEYPALRNWITETSDYIAFHQAVSKISTYSLALMKLNYVKQKADTNQ